MGRMIYLRIHGWWIFVGFHVGKYARQPWMVWGMYTVYPPTWKSNMFLGGKVIFIHVSSLKREDQTPKNGHGHGYLVDFCRKSNGFQ